MIEERRAQLVQPPKASSISASTPAARTTLQPSALSAVYSSSADLPIPASPRSTRTAL